MLHSKVIAFWNSEFGRVSYKKGQLNWIFRHFMFLFKYFCILSPILLKFGTGHLQIQAKNLEYCFEKMFSTFDVMPILHGKSAENPWKSSFFTISLCKFSIKSKMDNIFEKQYSRFFAYMCRCSVPNFSKSSPEKRKISENSNFPFFFVRNPTRFANFEML